MTRAPLLRRLEAMDARGKLTAAILVLGVALTGPTPWVPLWVGGVAIAASLSLGRRPGPLLRPLLFAFFAAAFALILRTLVEGPAAEPAARALALRLFSRMVAGIQVFSLFAFLTPPWSLMLALRRMGLPRELVDVFALAARYVAVLGPAARTAREAQVVRRGYSTLPRGIRSAGALAGLTLVRAFDQAHATAEAMAARGCEGSLVPPRAVRSAGR